LESNQRANTKGIVVARANRSLARTFWRPLWGRDWATNNGNDS